MTDSFPPMVIDGESYDQLCRKTQSPIATMVSVQLEDAAGDDVRGRISAGVAGAETKRVSNRVVRN